MAEKDISERLLEDYNDVFSDIINVILFEGERTVKPDELRPRQAISQYKAQDGRLHEQERDILKEWIAGNVEIAICGLENQTKAERLMPLRVIGYDGAAYRSQMLEEGRTRYVPVITIVLNFGNSRWNQPKTLKEVVDIPPALDRYVNDYRIKVVDVAYLTDAQLAMFTSDFGVVARFFVNRRKSQDYEPDDPTEIRHVDEVLKLLSVMTGDSRYEEVLTSPADEGEVRTMCDVASRLVDKGMERGIAQGRISAVLEMVGDGDITRDKAAEKLGRTPDEIDRMLAEFIKKN